jgi:hypothetical protein
MIEDFTAEDAEFAEKPRDCFKNFRSFSAISASSAVNLLIGICPALE